MSQANEGSLPEHLQRGRRGEQLAAQYLREKGWEIETMNFETKYGEIDIIARRQLEGGQGVMIAIVEVKTRSSSSAMPPELSVTADKRRRLTRMARAYDRRHGDRRAGYRFDIITVDLSEQSPQIRHFDAAFDASGRPY